MSVAIIPLPDGAASYVEIPRDEWTAMNQRAKVVVQDKAISSEVTKVVPNYPRLLPACQDWIDKTFPGMISHAIQVAGFATQAQKTLEDLQKDLKGIGPSDPVPDSVTFIITVNYKALAETAHEISDALAPLDPMVSAFVTENRTADETLSKDLAVFGSGWESLIDPLDSLDKGLSDTVSDWTSLRRSLINVSDGSITVTTADLLSQDLIGAISAWGVVKAAAVALDSWAGG
ncbi:hypothetical protein [Pararhodospirillum oryzae]|uniref:Uncharacterized protein n=1 Tax=Pararhodospirillum oryzae TaxID=478448 RepID=A0A512HBY0_9PROT|nr:hypothetical protein [Pararhodospirillum oryzae]GEO82952.1 hypothetical protein ROR02_30830 [Pararhodospirillum oryzae]